MKTFSIQFAFFLGCALWVESLHGQAPKEGDGRGVVIIASKQGPTRFLDSQEKILDAEKTEVGQALAEGNQAQAGIGGKVILLFSNGTVMTLESQTKVKIREFTQELFDAAGRKMSDLVAEPSKSNLKLDLDWGSIVVGTKKLDRESSMDIHSPTGTAGVRGTQFQLSQKPGTGVKLDVAESVVAFTPQGGASVPVGAGGGLDVAATGVSSARPINPIVANNIAVVNGAAVRMTSNFSLGVVANAMSEATENAGSGEGGDGDDSGGGDSGGSDEGGAGDKDEVGDSSSTSAAVDTSQVLENNPDARQSRKTGKVGPRARELSRFGLTDKQVEIFYSFDTRVQDALLAVGVEATKRLIGLMERGILEAHLSTFFSYAEATRTKMLGLEADASLANLLLKQYEEAWLTGILSDQNLLAMNAGQAPQTSPTTTSQESFLSLNDSLRESGNSQILEELLDAGGGVLTDELLREGEDANQLLTAVTFAGDFDGVSLVNGQEALANRFYQDVAVLYQTLEDDDLVAGQAVFLGGRTMTLSAGSYSIDGWNVASADAFAFGAADRLRLEGVIQFSGDAGAGKRIVVMSGNELESTSALTLDAATNDLVLSVRRDLVLDGAVLQGAREVAIHSLRDINLINSELSASELATLKAAKEMYLDGLSFNQDLPKIVMEATTIRLMNIDFPVNAAVNLNSLKGPIDSRYPNFGTDVSAAQQLGRVNFLQNVKAGGNLMYDRASFDQFGGKVTIGKSR